jgi:hypothetical protein
MNHATSARKANLQLLTDLGEALSRLPHFVSQSWPLICPLIAFVNGAWSGRQIE